MSNKNWYNVLIISEKTIKVYAESAEEAKEVADNKMQPLWSAETAHRTDGTIEYD